MLKKLLFQLIASLIMITISQTSFAQNAENSLLVNFGAASCDSTTPPSFSLIKDPLGANPTALTTCDLDSQLASIYGVFIAYNPANNKIYVASIATDTATQIWVLDVGLPANIACPPVISTTPDYSYSYVSNNFEFDNNGNIWSFSNYNDITGQVNMDNFDVNTGTVINTRIVQFPTGNFPNVITSGDVTILPNGRMFATLGNAPSKLYEIKNYMSTTMNATATFLDSLPQPCYGIAYLNGGLEISGSSFTGSCYYYAYNISTGVLDNAVNFQAGQLPIDNTSITPAIGVTKELLNATKVNSNTANLVYDIYVKNLGNVALNNINVSDNLAAVFGAGNISNVKTAFDSGVNYAGLILNTSYDGVSDTSLLIAGQNLANEISGDSNYFFKIQVSFQVTNLVLNTVYLNSAIGSGTIGNSGNSSFLNVADSSNNGGPGAVDPNNDGNAGEPGENVPTPFTFGTFPVHFISVAASLVNKTSAMVKWVVATPTTNSNRFEVEYSADGKNFTTIGMVKISSSNQGSYQFAHSNIPSGNLYYRIKEIDANGAYDYSNIVMLNNRSNVGNFVIYPNPANSSLTITSPTNNAGETQIVLYDAVGRQMVSTTMMGITQEINTTIFPNGTYVLKILNNGTATTQKVLIMHK